MRSRCVALVVSATLATLILVTGCGAGSPDPAPTSAAPTSAAPTSAAPTSAPPSPPPSEGGVQVLATGLVAPWGLAFLPGGDALVSERDSARILRIPAAGGTPVQVATVPEARPGGEAGLLGLAVSPSYDTDGLVYAYVTTATDNRILRFRLGEAPHAIVIGIPKGNIHDGGRLAFGPDGTLYAGTGETGNIALAQDPRSLGGKVLRMTPDGQPVAGQTSLVFSTGHRNVQGLAFDPAGRLWATEFGQARFDEVNQVNAGDNGGWPEIEGAGDGGGRFAAPRVTWTTAEASPSGLAVLGGALYVAALRGERLWRVPLSSDGVTGTPQALLSGQYGRLRTAVAAPDGSLWVLTSNRDGRGKPVPEDDRVLRLTGLGGASRA